MDKKTINNDFKKKEEEKQIKYSMDHIISAKKYYSENEVTNDLEYYEKFAEQIDEQIKELKDINSNENIDILEEVFMENLGFYTVNASIKDVEGGAVQTKHNIKKDVYASEDMKYNRGTYEDQKKMNEYKNSKKNTDGTLISEMTGKVIEGNGHTDHIVSAKEYHTEMGFAQSEEDKKKAINREDNFSVIEGSINQSKSDESLEEWKNKIQGGREVTNKEHFDYDDESAKETEKKDREMREKITKDQKKVLGKYYSKESIKKGALKGADMALKIAITEAIAITTKEAICHSKKNTNINTSFKEFISIVIDGFKIGVKKLFEEIINILKKMFKALANGLFETIITTVINIFFTTATSIIKSIRSIINMITDIKSQVSNLGSRTRAEKKKIMMSLLIKGILTLPILSGLGIIQTIEKVFLNIGVPNILSDILAIGISNFIGGLLLIIVSRYINEFSKAYNCKIANNIELLNSGMKTKISAIKAMQVQNELKESLQIGLNFLQNIREEEKQFVNSIKKNINNISETFNGISNITLYDSLQLATERIYIKDNSEEISEISLKLKNIKF